MLNKEAFSAIVVCVASLVLAGANRVHTLGAGAAAVDRQQDVRPAVGAISGVVTEGHSGRRMRDVLVSLRSRTPAGDDVLASQTTDDLGRFAFLGVAAGDVSLIARKPGYSSGEYGQREPQGPGTRISLRAGEWFQNAVVPLWRSGAIEGRVGDEVGQPVVGVVVQALRHISVAGVGRVAAGPTARTDDRGLYRISGLVPGSYFVSVVSVHMTMPAGALDRDPFAGSMPNEGMPNLSLAPDHRLLLRGTALPPVHDGTSLRVYPQVFFPSALSLAEAQPLALTNADATGIDFVLQPVRAVTIAGVVDAPAEELGNLDVRLTRTGNERAGSCCVAAIGRVGSDGAFVLTGVPSGTFTLEAAHSTTELAWRPTDAQTDMPAMPNDGQHERAAAFRNTPAGTLVVTTSTSQNRSQLWGRVTVAVEDQDIAGVRVPTSRGSALAGHIQLTGTMSNLRASVVSVSGFTVAAEPADGVALSPVHGTTSPSDPSRAFRIEGLQPGEYVLRVPAGGLTVKSIMWNGADYTHRPFDVSAGQDLSDIAVTLTDEAATLSGTASDPEALVLCFPADATQWSRYGLNPPTIRLATPAPDGTYSIKGLPAGDYHVAGIPRTNVSRWQEPAFLEAVSRSAARVSLSWNQSRVLDVKVSR